MPTTNAVNTFFFTISTASLTIPFVTNSNSTSLSASYIIAQIFTKVHFIFSQKATLEQKDGFSSALFLTSSRSLPFGIRLFDSWSY